MDRRSKSRGPAADRGAHRRSPEDATGEERAGGTAPQPTPGIPDTKLSMKVFFFTFYDKLPVGQSFGSDYQQVLSISSMNPHYDPRVRMIWIRLGIGIEVDLLRLRLI